MNTTQRHYKFVPSLALSLIPLALHLALALYYRFSGKIVMESPEGDPGYWNWLWQTLDTHLLQEKLWESIWNLHMQPPVHNLYGAIFINNWTNYLSAMHFANIGLSALLVGMLYTIAFSLTRARWLSFGMALVLALHPGLYIYAATPLYTILTTFTITLTVFCLAMYGLHRRRVYLVAFIAALNLVFMTRASYHLIFLTPALLIVMALGWRHWKQILLIALLISTVTFGWYTKNYIKFGVFGSSSWSGFNLFNIASANYPPEEIKRLGWEGVLGRPFQDWPIYFQQPDKFWLYGLYGKTSDVEALSVSSPNNINTPDISAMYRDNAIRLINYDRMHYVENVAEAYGIFNRPATQYGEIWEFSQNIRLHEEISSRVVQGQWLTDQINALFGIDTFTSMVYFLLPISVLGYSVALLRRNRLAWRRWRTALRADALMIFLTALIAYTTLVSIFLEHGENNRFKFSIEPVLAIYFVTLAHRIIQHYRKRKREAHA